MTRLVFSKELCDVLEKQNITDIKQLEGLTYEFLTGIFEHDVYDFMYHIFVTPKIIPELLHYIDANYELVRKPAFPKRFKSPSGTIHCELHYSRSKIRDSWIRVADLTEVTCGGCSKDWVDSTAQYLIRK